MVVYGYIIGYTTFENEIKVTVSQKNSGEIVHQIIFDTSQYTGSDKEMFDNYVHYMTCNGEYMFLEFIGELQKS